MFIFRFVAVFGPGAAKVGRPALRATKRGVGGSATLNETQDLLHEIVDYFTVGLTFCLRIAICWRIWSPMLGSMPAAIPPVGSSNNSQPLSDCLYMLPGEKYITQREATVQTQ